MDTASASLRRWAALALLTMPLFLAGCGEAVPSAGALHSVKGKVVFSKPEALSGLKIEFVPKSPSARPASGDIGADGRFTLKTGDAEGVAEGEYGVCLDKPGGFAKGKYNLPIPQRVLRRGRCLPVRVRSSPTPPSFPRSTSNRSPARARRGGEASKTTDTPRPRGPSGPFARVPKCRTRSLSERSDYRCMRVPVRPPVAASR